MMPMWNKKVTKKIYNHPNLFKKIMSRLKTKNGMRHWTNETLASY